jgi:hypothetical protein
MEKKILSFQEFSNARNESGNDSFWKDMEIGEEEETEERIGRLNDLFNMIEQMDNLHLTDENTQESPNLG